MKKCPNCGKLNLNEAKYCTSCSFDLQKPKTGRSKLKIIAVLIIFIFIIVLGVGLYSTFNQQNNTPNFSEMNVSEGDVVDEVITSQNEKVQYKKVNFNGLFSMYVPEDSKFEECDPENNATYEWNSEILFVRYYDQYDDVNQLVSLLMDNSPSLRYSTEGNLFIVDNFKVNGVDNIGYVIVQSQDNKFVVISSRGDLETTKTLAKSVVFD